MSKLKEIMVKYATQRGGGLPLTPEEMCNAVVLWVESVFDNLSIEGGYLVQVQKEGTQFTININTEQLDTDIKANYFNAIDLSELFEGSETVVVDVNEQDNKIEIHLDSEVVQQLGRAILKPLNAPTEDSVPIVTETNSVDYVPLSQIGGGGGGTQLYKHQLGGYTLPSGVFAQPYVVTLDSTPYTSPSELFNGCSRYGITGRLTLNGNTRVCSIVAVGISGELYVAGLESAVYLSASSAFTDSVTPL